MAGVGYDGFFITQEAEFECVRGRIHYSICYVDMPVG